MSDLRLEKTCSMCPEQYDVFLEDRQVGYIRVRWGGMWVSCPRAGGEMVYHNPDVGFGFLTDKEREELIPLALEKIQAWSDENE